MKESSSSEMTRSRRPRTEAPLAPQRVDVDARLTDATASAMLSKAERDLLEWFGAAQATLEERIDALSSAQIRALLNNVRKLVARQEARFTCMLEISSALGSTFHVDDLLKTIVEKTTELMDAERSTIFLIDEESGELWSKIIQGTVNIEIRLQPGQGVAGWVASTGQSLNISDAYRDERFNPRVDENTGYQTRNILCQPIRNLQGDTLGVIQVLNRVTGNFTASDEQMLSAIASQAAVALENSKLYLAAVAQNMELIEIKDKLEHKVAELDMLFELERQIGQAADLEELIEGVFRRTAALAHAQLACLTLRGERKEEVYILSDRGEWETDWQFEHRRVASGSFETLALGSNPSLRWSKPPPQEGWADDPQRAAIRAALEERQRDLDRRALSALLAHRERLFEEPISNLIIVPLSHKGIEIGAFELFNTNEEDDLGVVGFGEDTRKIVSLVAAQLTASIAARRRREEEEKNARLASIGQMLSGVLHDLKNPMAIISGYVQLMARADDPEVRRQYASSVLTQFEQLNQMTRELLMFARGDQHILLRKVFLHKFMAEVGELLEPELVTKGVTLKMDLEYRNDIKLDQVKMKRAILNLARNAAEAMDQGGHFTIHVRRIEAGASVSFPEAHVLMTLSDDGPGIPVEIRDRLFESFVTQGKKDGTGLGLAIVEKIIADHHGTIEFETESGQGTTFSIRLPIDPGAATAPPQERS